MTAFRLDWTLEAIVFTSEALGVLLTYRSLTFENIFKIKIFYKKSDGKY